MSAAPVDDRTPPAGPGLWSTSIDRESPVPLSRQLADALRRSIAEGRLGSGARLPSTRVLAAELGLARSTVVTVFEQLVAEGFLSARAGSGYFVATLSDEPQRGDDKPTDRPVSATPRRLSRHAALVCDLPPPLPRGAPRPFELGYAEIDGRFMTTWKRLASRALSGRSRLPWFYGDAKGEPALRRAIADYLAAARGVRCDPEQIVLTGGTQQGLSLAVRLLLDPGDTAWVEDPCYRSACDILRAAEARLVPIAVDDHGLDIAAGIRRGIPAPRLVYTTPSRQYPLGVTMPLARRLELLDWAGRAGVWVLEDDYESEFQQQGRTLPALQGLDRAGRVLYLGTFSKLLFPSLRLGYAVLPEDLASPFAASRHLVDRQSSALLQTIMTDFILDGHFARHLKRMRALYAERQAWLIDLLSRRLKGLVDIRPTERGMYAIAWLPPSWSDRAAARALAAAEVVALPLSSLTLETPRPPGLVLGYTGHGIAAMTRAVERTAGVFERQTGLASSAKLDLRQDQMAP
jgi:GntR family transcriptional regulator/MocR family aminotransferase